MLAAALHKTKGVSRKAYDWPLNLEKLLRRKTSAGALVVALHQWPRVQSVIDSQLTGIRD